MKTSDKHNLKRPFILIADDNDMCLDVLAKMLDKLGYDVCAVHDGREAIKTYKSKQDKINLVILDMQMPYNGEKTYTQLRKINSNLRILLVSGYSKDCNIDLLLEQGKCSFMNKPFTMSSLKINVSELIK